ncbi:hypothetical protein D9Q98_002125 [Chlorella vulgaris]|uniref:Alpha-galactosidase n=1 Tax=Chlorella vulgaris TaxID=3077 RepID=A0A9D4Z0Y5_CHLVU|nr:hypothetical protein D9Q98_002125 [Chlorella vulgaris]
MTRSYLRFAAWLACALLVTALDNGLNAKPAMGWNSWNAFGPTINEEIIKDTADRLVALGLRDAGYVYLNLDDGWSDLKRTADGRLTANKTAFPSGIPALAKYVHSKGLKFGIYADAGNMTCAGFPGSLGFEEVDAQTFADWGVDYLKYDNCYAAQQQWVVDRYTAMRDALNATGRPILYSLCNWGVAEPWLWASGVGNSWRTTEDIEPTWDNVVKLLEYNVGLSQFAGPSRGWNDLDMLFVGNSRLGEYHPFGPFYQEQRAHFALWALFKSPLFIGHDLRNLNSSFVDLLKKKEIVAMNQDELGVAGDLIWQQGTRKIFATALAGGSRGVVLWNLQTTQSQYPLSNITVFWEQIGLGGSQRATVRDVFSERDLGVFSGSFSAAVAFHDVAVLRVTPVEGPLDDSWRPWHAQPLYAPQPANLAVPSAAAWIAGYTGPSSSGSGPGSKQQPDIRKASFSPPASSGPPSFAVVLSVLASLAALGVVGYFVVLHMRMRGWQQLDENEGARKMSEMSQTRRYSPPGS